MQQEPILTTLMLLRRGLVAPGPIEAKLERIEEALDRLEAALKPPTRQ